MLSNKPGKSNKSGTSGKSGKSSKLVKRCCAAVALSAAAVLVVGCSSSGDGVSSDAVGQPSVPAAADPASWSPVVVTPELDGEAISLLVGQKAVVRGLSAGVVFEAEAAPEGVVDVVVPADGGDPVGVSGVVPGSATVTVWELVDGERDQVLSVVVNVPDAAASGGAEGEPAAVVVTPGMSGETLRMTVGQEAVFRDVPEAVEVVVRPADRSTVSPRQPDAAGREPGFVAAGPGRAGVQLVDSDGAVLVTVSVVVSAASR